MDRVVQKGKRSAKRLALAFAGVTTAAAIIGSKFEFELTKTATVARAFGKDLDALRDKARELGATTAFTSTQAARGMYDLASAGMTTREILDGVEHAMKLAGATGAEMSQATRLLASTMSQFGLEATESKRIVDTYAQAITSSQLTMERLTEAMKFAGTTGASLGWTLEETAAAVAMFANLGLEGSMSGTNLRMAMISLAKGTKLSQDALADMGLTLKDVNPEGMSFGEILKKIGEEAMAGKQAVEIFGARSGLNLKQLAKLVREGKFDFDNFVDSLHKAQEGAGRADKMYQRLMGTFKGTWKRVISAGQAVFEELFFTMEKSGRDAFETIIGKLGDLRIWIRDHGDELKSFWSSVSNWIKVAAEMASGLGAAMGKIFEVLMAAKKEKLITPEGEGILGPEWGPRQENRERAAQAHEMRRRGLDITQAPSFLPGAPSIAQLEHADAMKTFRENQQKKLKEISKSMIDDSQDTVEKNKALWRDAQDYWDDLADEYEATWYEANDKLWWNTQKQLKKQADLQSTIKDTLLTTEEMTATDVLPKQEARHNLERERTKQHYDNLIDLMRDAGFEQVEIDKVIAAKRMAITAQTAEHEKSKMITTMELSQKFAGQMSSTFETMYQAGILQGKKGFAWLKAIKIVEAIVHTATAVAKTLGEPQLPFPLNIAMAGLIAAQGAAQVALIAKQKPPEYFEGGRVRGSKSGTLIRAGEGYRDEVVVPLRSGNIPVKFAGTEGPQREEKTEIHEHFHFEGAVFQDQRTLAAALDTIAVNAVQRDYRKGGKTRTMIRRRP